MNRPLGTVGWLLLLWIALPAAPAAAHFGPQPPKDLYLGKRIAEIREGTARFQDVRAAEAAGYRQFTGNVPLVGTRFVNPTITTFAYDRPAGLIYIKMGERWELTGLEYAIPGERRPEAEPFPGIAWSYEPPTCRYTDWHELESPSRDRCPATHPEGASLASWQPGRWYIRVWVWYPNPSGVFARLNPILAPFHEENLPPGGFWSWAAWQEDVAYSNRNHHVAGWFVLLIAILLGLEALDVLRPPWLRFTWPVLAIGIGVLILFFSDPEGWPVGSLTLAQSLASEEVREHKLSGLIVLGLGSVEYLRLRGTLATRAWDLLLPLLCIGVGAILVPHRHAVSNFAYLGRANVPHVTEGITIMLMGVAKILHHWRLWRGRAAALAWPALLVALALQLILYTE